MERLLASLIATNCLLVVAACLHPTQPSSDSGPVVHSTTSVGKPLRLSDEAQSCEKSEDCILVEIFPDAGHSNCRDVINRAFVAEFRALVTANEADFRLIHRTLDCGLPARAVCRGGRCTAE
jgi:hypothetical protein